MIPVSFEEDQGAALDLFRRSAKARLWMRVALRCGVPYSKVRDEWDDDDLAAFAAWESFEAESSLDRCPGCGVEPGDMVDPDTGRRLPSPRWKFVHLSCVTCSDLAKFNEEASPGARTVLHPRVQGDPVEEERRI